MKKLSALPNATIDCWAYVLIAVFGALAAAFGSDEAAKFINPFWLWVFKTTCTAIGAGLLAFKMFRSTAFAELQEEKKGGTWPPIKPQGTQ